MAGNTKIIGIEGLQAKFLELRQDMTLRTARRMVAAAGTVLKKEAKAIAQSKGLKISGDMIRNIAIKRETKVPEGITQYHLGVRHGRGLGKRARKEVYEKKAGKLGVRYLNNPFYYRFVESGHKFVARSSGDFRTGATTYVTTLRNGKKVIRTRKFSYDSITGRRRSATGFVEANPFLAPALENKQQEAIAAMEDRLTKDLAKYK